MCKNIDAETRAFWEAADAEARRLRDEDGKIPGKKGVTICVSPQKSPEPQKKRTGPAPSPPVKKKETDDGPAPSPQPKHTGNGWNAWRAGN